MKKYLTLIFFLALSSKLYCQDIAMRLQKQMWYVKGDLYKGDTCSLYTEKVSNCTGYLVFGPDELEMHLNATDNKLACKYQTLNNKIMLSSYITFKGTNSKTEEVKIFYALKESQSYKDIFLIPISDKDYR